MMWLPRKHRYQTVLEQQLYNPALSGKMDPGSRFRRRSSALAKKHGAANTAKVVCLVPVGRWISSSLPGSIRESDDIQCCLVRWR